MKVPVQQRTVFTLRCARDTRAELPFTVEESVDRQNQNVSFVFSSPTCRLTMKIEKEVLHDGVWARLNPEPERD